MPPPPPRPPTVTSRGGSSDTRGHASRVNADAPPACDDGARPTAGGALASLVLLVVVMSGRAMVCLTPGGHVAQAALQAPFTAAGRKSVVSSAATLLSSHYHLSEVQAPLLFAGAFPKRSPVEYVVAAMVEDAVVEDETAFAELVRSMLGSKAVRGSWPGWGSGKGLNSFRPRAASRIHPARTSRDLKRAKTLPLPARARNARSASDSTLFGTSSERSSVSEPG